MKYKYKLPGGNAYNLFLDNLNQTHLLIAGTTGSGKSVIENNIIATALLFAPCQYELILIDTKRVELSNYKDLPHCLYYANDTTKAVNALRYAVELMEKRYKIMEKAGYKKYNGSKILVIIDELADLMTTNKREVMPLLQRILQVGRASGIMAIACTQCPLTTIIPTQLKCNFDAKIGLRTRSKQDSRNVIDKAGLEMLPRYGQGVYITPEVNQQITIPMIDENEIQRLVKHWKNKENTTMLLF